MRDNTFKWIATNYIADHAPKTNSEDSNPSLDQNAPPSKVCILASNMFLDDDEDEEMKVEEEIEVPTIKSQVDKYLLLSQISFTMAFDILDWWHTRSAMWPNLSKMA